MKVHQQGRAEIQAARTLLGEYFGCQRPQRLHYSLLRRRGAIQQLFRRNRFSHRTPDILVLSRPQLTNLGDTAIAVSISQAIRETKGWSIGNLSVDNPNNWMAESKRGVLVGGGSVASAGVIRAANKLGQMRDVVLWGVEVFGDDESIDWHGIRQTTVRTYRSMRRAKELGCADPMIAPDAVWLLNDFGRGRRGRSERPILGINATCWPKNLYFKAMTAALSDDENEKLVQFVVWLRVLTKNALRHGWAIQFVPFEIDDYYFSKSIMRDFVSSRVEILRYSNDPFAVLKSMTAFDLFVATRYHAHIFALKAQAPLVSVPYSFQVASLGKEFNWSRSNLYPYFVGEELSAEVGFVLRDEEIRRLCEQCSASLVGALDLLNG